MSLFRSGRPWAVLACVLILSGVDPLRLAADPARPESPPTALRAMVWNLRSTTLVDLDADWRQDLAEHADDPEHSIAARTQRQLIDFLRHERPDVLFAVEVYGAGPTVLAGLNAGLPAAERYRGVPITRDAPQQDEDPTRDNLWIFTRIPVAEIYPVINESPVTSFHFGGVRLRLPSGKHLSAFATWLDHRESTRAAVETTASARKRGEPDPYTQEEILATDRARRLEQARVILQDRIPGQVGDHGDSVIIGGDFNTLSHLDWATEFKDAPGHEGLVLPFPVTRSFYEAGFVDAYREVHPDAGRYSGRTFSPVTSLHYAPSRIDYLMTRGADVRAVAAHTHLVRLPEHRGPAFAARYPFYSDHGPVVTDLLVDGGGASPFPAPRHEPEPTRLPDPLPVGRRIDPTMITATASSFNPGQEPKLVLDGDPRTAWRSRCTQVDEYNCSAEVALPQHLTLELDRPMLLTGLTYEPTDPANGRVFRYRIDVSLNGRSFRTVAAGHWLPDDFVKSVPLRGRARYVRLVVDAGYWGTASAGEFALYERAPH